MVRTRLVRYKDNTAPVLQRHGAEDAVGNNMGRPGQMRGMTAGTTDVLVVAGEGTPVAQRSFPLSADKEDLNPVPFNEGSATAMAIGVFEDDQGKQRALFWSEPVRLTGPGAAAA